MTWPFSSGKTTTAEKPATKSEDDTKKDGHHISTKNKACAHRCLDWTLYKPFNLIRYGGIALVSSWAGMMALKYLTTSSENPEFEKRNQDLSYSIMWMVSASVANCGSNFLHKKSIIEGLAFTTKYFCLGLAQEYFVNGIRNEPNSFVDRLHASAQNLTHGIL